MQDADISTCGSVELIQVITAGGGGGGGPSSHSREIF